MDPGEFKGVIADDFYGSTPWWPAPRRPGPGTPNVVLVVLDDVGFAQLGCFGSDIDTPVIDRLARSGLQYTNFHTTALCSPTRASLLTGRNATTNGMTTIQVQVADAYRGRVIANYITIIQLGFPLGALIEGAVASVTGTRVLALGSAVLLLAYFGLVVTKFRGLRDLDDNSQLQLGGSMAVEAAG